MLTAKRSQQGNMMTLTFLIIGFVATLLFVGLLFYLVLSDQRRAQSQCDSIALDLAKLLNGQDQIGQLNQLLERARESVYLARQDQTAAYELNNKPYEILSDKLIGKARAGAALIEKERLNLVDVSIKACQGSIYSWQKSRLNENNSIVPALLDKLDITQVQFGSLDNLSSISSPSIISNLHQYDLTHHYIDKNSNLYYAMDVRLPDPDNDLPFLFSNLPAKVESTESPERLLEAQNFLPDTTIYDANNTLSIKPKQLPSAIRVKGSIRVAATNGQDKINLQADSSAAVPGTLSSP